MGKTCSVAEARNRFSEIISTATFSHEAIIIERRGKPIAAIIGIEEYEALAERLEELQDIKEAEEALKEHASQGRNIRELFAEIESG
mgnify:FL=1